jgi:DNA replication and repair protein RecF
VRVDRVALANVRCYTTVDVALHAGITAVVGDNGAGKTSLLEGLHLACLGYSPRTSIDTRVIRDDAEFLRAEATGTIRGASHTTAAVIQRAAAKRLTIDGRTVRRHADLDAWWVCLVFLPDRLAVVKRSPAIRRAWLDRAASRIHPPHADTTAAYAHALAQRNALLRRVRAGVTSGDALDPWDDQLAGLGDQLATTRRGVCETLAPLFQDRVARLGGSGSATLRYRRRLDGDADTLLRALRDRRDRDTQRATTGSGPHLDDVELVEGRRDLRAYGSQGEQRTALLALLLAEAALVTETRGEQPVLLLDDVVSELDPTRRRHLLAAVREHGQAIITTTDAEHLPDPPDLLIRVRAGTLQP